jgi:hypothetical protein
MYQQTGEILAVLAALYFCLEIVVLVVTAVVCCEAIRG